MCDVFTADLLDSTQAYVLAAIEHATRRIRILGVTLHPTGEWTAQQARNLMMDLDIRTPRMNAIAERWIGGCRRELLHRARHPRARMSARLMFPAPPAGRTGTHQAVSE